ncbi:MAG: ABC transporter substrate-binding protein [Candidatus Methanomethylicia archaeon]
MLYLAKLKQGTFNGKIYALSSGFELTWLHLRKDLAEKAKVLDLFPFKSVDDLYAAAEKLTGIEKGVYGIGWPLGSSGFDCGWTFNEFLYGFGGKYAVGRSSKDVVIGKEPYRTAAKKALEVAKKVWDNKWTPPDSYEWTDISNNLAYLDGRVAMTSNPMSIYYAVMTGKPELTPKTMLVPDLFPIDLGDESCFIFKGPNEDLAKELILEFFKDKEAYRKGWCTQSWWYNLPIFKSQLDVLSDEWKNGKHPYWGIDPKEALSRIVGVDIFEPFPIGVIDSWYRGWGVNEMVVRAVIKGEDFDKVIDDTQKKLEDMMLKEYGK